MKRDDLGVLSEAEVEHGDRPTYTYGEREQGWLYFHLQIAAQCRALLLNMDAGSPEYGDEVHRRRAALSSALLHIRNLRRVDHPMDALLASMLKAEGI